jgi:asparagine synthase (glutamine-hydrolysing)
MCGITGYWDLSGATNGDALTAQVSAMAEAIGHRGPDGRGVFVDVEAGLALGHLRLSIIDLSPAGAQPMISADGRWVIVFNGEVYNFREIRAELEATGRQFRGSSDTEVLVEACALWGVRSAASRCNGMFAFAVYDRFTRELWLARDHIGIKPLYVALQGKALYFGSELKALRAHPRFVAALDQASAASFLRFGYVPAPWSIYAGVSKVEPGQLVRIGQDGEARKESYYSFPDTARARIASRAGGTEAELIDGLEALLGDAVQRQMVADVPVGVLLSGGIDSSTVAALAQATSNRPVKSFAVGFAEARYDEAEHAAAVARHLGTDHTELHVGPGLAQDVLTRLPEMYDEPFADSSQIPTYLVSALTRQHVTVVLSGDGGDELFGGYDRYFHGSRLLRGANVLPRPLLAPIAGMLRRMPVGVLDAISAGLPERTRLRRLGTKLRKAAAVIDDADPTALYRRLMSHFGDMDGMPAGQYERRGLFWDRSLETAIPDPIERMQYIDTMTYLPDDILTKVDRASMAVSLEARVPFLDHRVVAYAWSLPLHMKVRGPVGKWALRQVLHRHVPKSLVERPKMGFGAPVGAWLRGPLRAWAEDLLSPSAIADIGLLDVGMVRRRWLEHLSGAADWQYSLWSVLMFESWRRNWLAPRLP